ncbi:MAG TPA: hypothetical protein VGD13_14525 [Xanthobacteraceae bacterium]
MRSSSQEGARRFPDTLAGAAAASFRPVEALTGTHGPNDESWPGLILKVTGEGVLQDIESIQEAAIEL